MKNVLFMLMLVLIGTACTKQETRPHTAIDYSKAVWVTPNGKVIPYSERSNWKAYEKAHFTEEKMGKKYGSEECTTDEIKCGLKCVSGKGTDCDKASDCAPCMNCGCTPIENPYE